MKKDIPWDLVITALVTALFSVVWIVVFVSLAGQQCGGCQTFWTIDPLLHCMDPDYPNNPQASICVATAGAALTSTSISATQTVEVQWWRHPWTLLVAHGTGTPPPCRVNNCSYYVFPTYSAVTATATAKAPAWWPFGH